MSKVRRLDEVAIFNQRLSFLIPHEWIEVDSGDVGTYLYQLPDPPSGWFRVSLVTTKGVANPVERLRQLFSESGNVEVNETTENLIRRSEKDTVEDGYRLHIYYWFIGGCVAPDMVCEAVFSYTVLADWLDRDETQSEVRLLNQLIGKARFNAVE
jgi:hypothetical protein